MSNVNETQINENVEEVVELVNTLSPIEYTEESPIQSNYVLFDELRGRFEIYGSGLIINDILEIKKYIGIMYKQVAINNITSMSKQIYNDDLNLELGDELLMGVNHTGLTKINHCNFELFYGIKIIEFYTNLIISADNMVEQYDYLVENGILDLIYNEIGKVELSRFNELLQKEMDQTIKIENSIELIVNKHMTELQYIVSDNLDLFQSKLEVLINKVPDMTEGKMEYYLNEAKETLKSFSPKAYKTLNKVMKFAEGKGTGK